MKLCVDCIGITEQNSTWEKLVTEIRKSKCERKEVTRERINKEQGQESRLNPK